MSFKAPEAQNYDKFVSLDEYVLVSIMKHLESATNYLLEGDQAGAILNLNYAWTISPFGVRKKLTENPAKLIAQRVLVEVPDLHEILKNRAWLRSVNQDEVDSYLAKDGGYLSELDMRAEIYRLSKIAEVIQSVLFTFQLSLVEGLEAVGLYISKSRGTIIPTADRIPEVPLPILKKLAASQPR